MPEETVAPSSSAAWRAAKNSVYAIVEFAWPVALAILVTPFVVRGLGANSYGVLSIVAVTLGFFGLLDLGIGGAAIRAVSQALGSGDTKTAARIVGTVVTVYLVIGVVGTLSIAIATPFLVSHVFSIPADLQASARAAFLVSAVGFPVSLMVGVFASIPKAAQRFDLSTRVAVIFSTLNPMVTLILVWRGLGLDAVVLGSLTLNALAAVAYFHVSRRLLGGFPVRLGIDATILRSLARFGGWFLIASIGIVVLYQLDKLLVGSLVSVAAVTFYVVPGNLATRIQGLVGAATQIVFPTSAALLASDRKDALVRLYRDGTRISFVLATGLGVPTALMASHFLLYWIGRDFADRSTLVMCLLVGTYVLLGLTGVAWGLGFGSGKAWLNALFAVGMGIADVVLFLVFVPQYGINGAAFAYLLSALAGVPLLIASVERAVLGLSGWEFLREYARVAPAVFAQAALGYVLDLTIARNLPLTLVAMVVTAVALPILYLVLGLATPQDRALFGQLVARLKPR